jgi:hypothetical protein
MLFHFFLPVQAEENLQECRSVQERVIHHANFIARDSGLKKRILVLAQIHGDEPQSHQLAKHWISRLEKIQHPSNHWRIIPSVNPDGTLQKVRFNANGVDLNRNFPTKQWDQLALSDWKNRQQKNPRRFPGKTTGSEPETKCVISHIQDFKPDLVIAIHTPYGLFDFDGPEGTKLKTGLLPWKRLGTFPGSLGRYLWDERNIPVLTIELRPDSLDKNLGDFLVLQDSLSDLLKK